MTRVDRLTLLRVQAANPRLGSCAASSDLKRRSSNERKMLHQPKIGPANPDRSVVDGRHIARLAGAEAAVAYVILSSAGEGFFFLAGHSCRAE